MCTSFEPFAITMGLSSCVFENSHSCMHVTFPLRQSIYINLQSVLTYDPSIFLNSSYPFLKRQGRVPDV